MIYLYLFGTCFHFIYVFMIIAKIILFICLIINIWIKLLVSDYFIVYCNG